jgi:hypothetical protein
METKCYKKLRTAEIRFMRDTTEYSVLDRRGNEDTSAELIMHAIKKNVVQYEKNWLDHIRRMGNIDTNTN